MCYLNFLNYLKSFLRVNDCLEQYINSLLWSVKESHFIQHASYRPFPSGKLIWTTQVLMEPYTVGAGIDWVCNYLPTRSETFSENRCFEDHKKLTFPCWGVVIWLPLWAKICWLSFFSKAYHMTPHFVRDLMLLQKALEAGSENLIERSHKLSSQTCLMAFTCKYRNFNP